MTHFQLGLVTEWPWCCACQIANRPLTCMAFVDSCCMAAGPGSIKSNVPPHLLPEEQCTAKAAPLALPCLGSCLPNSQPAMYMLHAVATMLAWHSAAHSRVKQSFIQHMSVRLAKHECISGQTVLGSASRMLVCRQC